VSGAELPSAWSTDRGELDEPRVRALLAEALPHLRVGRLRFLGVGFDHDAWAVDDTLVFRFPRRADVLAFEAAEAAALDRIGDRLPLQVPLPLHRCVPRASFPYPFFGAQLIRGQAGDTVAFAPTQLPGLARQLAEALRALHAIDTKDLAVPVIGDRAEVLWHAMRTLAPRFRAAAPRDLVAAAEPFLARVLRPSARANERCLLHADLAGEHDFVDPETGRATGIVDWSDAAIGDPALDFAGLWLWLGEAFARDAIGAYAPAEIESFTERVRFAAQAVGVIEAARPERMGGDEAFARARRAFVASP
jgi:aminoglycoside phosphotransferase (APT) family kinase protein